MPRFSQLQLTEVMQAEALRADKNSVYSRFVFDSRKVLDPETLFFAFSGEQQNGHRFVASLECKPGVCAVVEHGYQLPEAVHVPLLRVADPMKAAQQLAAHARNNMVQTRFVGVTGSAGKTSAKEFIYQILNHCGTAYRSPGNWNNWLGLPFSLLNMRGDETEAVFELGMSQPGVGEIDLLTRILRPHAAVILNALPVHLEFLKSVERVAEAKCEILAGLEPEGFAFFNMDSPELSDQLKRWPGKRLIPFSPTRSKGALHYISRKVRENGADLVCSYRGKTYRFFSPLIHPAQLVNILVAIGMALELGLDDEVIARQVSSLTACSGRGVVRCHSGLTILDETYNSNPEAARYALDWLHSFTGSKVAVLGDMLELGEQSEVFHHQLGEYAATIGLKKLITVGPRSKSIADGAIAGKMLPENVIHSASAEACREIIGSQLSPGDVVLFKASRGIGLEKAIPQ